VGTFFCVTKFIVVLLFFKDVNQTGMPGLAFEKIRANVLAELKKLDPHLTYHSIDHTIDVVIHSERIAAEEGIINERDLFLLKVAALYHDSGFLETYKDHEKISYDIFLRTAGSEFTEDEKNIIRGLILSTKIPQQPKTHMERIICDADLDYLGRNDFKRIGDALRREFTHYKVVSNDEEWEKLQLKFLQNHKYHTKTSQKQREPVKHQHYSRLIADSH
jgi:predicted metal-dependent HD superfamily phosphohydrolase